MKTVARYMFECLNSRSNKFYELKVVQEDDRKDRMNFALISRWGKRTGNWKEEGGTTKVLERDAHYGYFLKNKVASIIRSKTSASKGYVEIALPKKKKKLKKEKDMEEMSLERFSMLEF